MSDALWRAATEHAFLLAVRDDAITPAAFDRWLVQDAHFVTDLLEFQALLLARAPRPAQRVLASGCVALVDELDWFAGQASERGLDLTAARLPATDDYAGLLDRLDAAPPAVALTALWVIERVYLDAWTLASGSAAFAAFTEHWTTPEFAGYVDDLRAVADPDAHADTVADVLRCEIAFWDAALS